MAENFLDLGILGVAFSVGGSLDILVKGNDGGSFYNRINLSSKSIRKKVNFVHMTSVALLNKHNDKSPQYKREYRKTKRSPHLGAG